MIIRTERIGPAYYRPMRKKWYALHRQTTRQEYPVMDRDTGEPNGHIVFYDWRVRDLEVPAPGEHIRRP